MGNNLTLTEKELDELSQSTGYSHDMLSGMYKKFCKLDKEEKGHVSLKDFQQQIKTTEISDKALRQFSDFNEEVDFKKVVEVLSAFQNNNEEQKLKFLFEMLDEDGDGLLGEQDLVQGFKPIRQNNLIDSDLSEIAQQTIKFSDKDGDNKLNFSEFKTFYSNLLQINI